MPGASRRAHAPTRRLERQRHRFRAADAVDHVFRKPRIDSTAHPFGMVDGQEGRHPRTHGVTHDIGLHDAQVIKQAGRIIGHDRCTVECRIIQLGAFAMATIVDRNDRPPCPFQNFRPSGIDPVDPGIGGKPMDQQDRIALAAHAIGNLNAV